MTAIIEPAVRRFLEYFGEVVSDLFGSHVYGTESLDSRCVDKISSCRTGQSNHLRKGGGVHAGTVCIADFRRAQVYTRNQPVNQRAFPYAAVSCQ